ncbi:hypothetical protein JQ609_24150 [Bradyrhizobium sp. AUGA SZCCT0169]|uniref:hypothetical protein n=1 Tax=Bradyrhizobium sp. AUGA SZCCT0169 TaxID=2807663 RepID=UPI001BA8EBA9|nr:hypothetical protein [Bradyrhizobium sp. AUGA SZCCT0169]MBR1250004.1 hypothetical protein [Bradyrhizobium sp. AUGA SZCCT0169]
MSNSENVPATSRRPRQLPPARIRIKGIQGNIVSFGSPGPANLAWRKQLKTAFGTVSDDFVDMALHHLERAARMPGDGASDVAINAAIAMIAAFAPKNEVEAALALQAACTHMAALAVMSRIGGAGGGAQRLPALASATTKLLRAYCTQVETYRRQRGGGDQNIRVEHVHVHEGGQAIVGSVNSRAYEPR